MSTGPASHGTFAPEEAFARNLDERDPLARLRERFRIPAHTDGEVQAYFCGNSLGLQPVAAEAAVQQELDSWADLAVDAHFDGPAPWYPYHERFRESAARLVGANSGEVVMMNGLTTNLHLMLVSFYRPTSERHAILMEDAAFPSDSYAIRTQIRYHGHDPERSLILASPRDGESTLRTEDIEALIDARGDAIALVLLGGVHYYTGQAFDLPRIAAAARRKGCVVGFDLAHAAGNLVLALHDWDVDFAVWCSYKYLNSGPGGVAGCFVHERHHDADLPRFAGWWGNDPRQRFRMHLEPEFRPVAGAEGWQLSNPPILAMAPLRASLDLFDEAGMPALRQKSEVLTSYLEWWVARAAGKRIEQITPQDPAARGCQLSLLVRGGDAKALVARLQDGGIVADYREPDVLRVAPVPLYNSFHDVWRFGQALEAWAD